MGPEKRSVGTAALGAGSAISVHINHTFGITALFPDLLEQQLAITVSRSAASAPAGNLLEIQVMGPHPRPTESELWG